MRFKVGDVVDNIRYPGIKFRKLITEINSRKYKYIYVKTDVKESDDIQYLDEYNYIPEEHIVDRILSKYSNIYEQAKSDSANDVE